MPRGGARRNAGRKPGSLERRHKVHVEDPSGILPLDWLLAVLRDPLTEQSRKDRAAEIAAPYVHARLSAIEARVAHRKAVTAENINVVQIFAVPRGGVFDVTAGTITIEGSPLEAMPIVEPYTPTPPIGQLTDQTAAVYAPPEPRLEVIKPVDDGKVEPLARWRRKPDPDPSVS